MVCSLVAVNAAPLHAQALTLNLDPAGTKIEFTLGASFHTVHGTFHLKSGTIHFDPATGKASGIITVDSTSAETGNESRDRKMHKDVLESAKYPEVTFSPTEVVGAVSTRGDSTVQVKGIFRLHGDEHAISFTIPVQLSPGKLAATTHFTIPYVAWGLKNPSNLFLHVSDKVEVSVAAVGQIAP